MHTTENLVKTHAWPGLDCSEEKSPPGAVRWAARRALRPATADPRGAFMDTVAPPPITNDAVVLGLLMSILGLVFWSFEPSQPVLEALLRGGAFAAALLFHPFDFRHRRLGFGGRFAALFRRFPLPAAGQPGADDPLDRLQGAAQPGSQGADPLPDRARWGWSSAGRSCSGWAPSSIPAWSPATATTRSGAVWRPSPAAGSAADRTRRR